MTADPAQAHVLPTYRTLLTSTVGVLLAACRSECRRIVLTGSLTEPLPGPDEAVPSSPYSAAKWAGAAYGRMFHLLYGSPVVIVRPFMVYGPAQHEDKVVPHVITSFIRGIRPRLASGTWRADWVYVSDVVRAMVQASYAADVEGRTFDLGSGSLVSIREVVSRIARLMEASVEPDFGARPDRPEELLREADVAATSSGLGWTATTMLDEGLETTIDWFRSRTT